MVNDTATEERETLTTEEAAQRLKVSSLTVRRMCYDGRIPAAKIGRHWIIYESDLTALIRQRRHAQFEHAKKELKIP